MQKSVNKLLIFTKAPILGEVKTRLQPEYSKKQSLKLHEYLALNTLQKVEKLINCEIDLCCTPSRNYIFFLKCENQYPINLVDQLGDNLGERMAFALSSALQTHEKVLIIGTDCPELNESYINQALEKLDEYDAVIGPADDGGYVLLGLKCFSPELFSDINWGTDSVLHQTRNVLKKMNWLWFELEVQYDIDRPEDLKRHQYLINELN